MHGALVTELPAAINCTHAGSGLQVAYPADFMFFEGLSCRDTLWPPCCPAPQVLGEDGKRAAPFSKVIYVMEDVDAASVVVHKRNSGTGSRRGSGSQDQAAAVALQQLQQEADAAAAGTCKSKKSRKRSQHNESGSDGDGDDANAAGGSAEDDIKGTADQSRQLAVLAAMASPDEAAGSDCDEVLNSSSMHSSRKGSPIFGPGLPKGLGKVFKADDELNLAGLLNVLDGVVDTPGRIIIMTSNHPEKLDPALIRPGRINKRVYMGRLVLAEALAMVRHYFAGCGGASEAQAEELRAVLVDDVLSPAGLESMCAEFECVEQLVEALRAHPGLRAVNLARQQALPH
jgi:hypothetical protein